MTKEDNKSWLKDPLEFTNITFDYIVVGGGTGGLTVASRLAENSQFNVGVIEAGPNYLEEPAINVPARWYNSHLDRANLWPLATTPQKHAHDRSIPLLSGKMLGGSSAVNLMAYMRASKQDYDHWEALGNPGWNWESLVPYFKKTETFAPQKAEVIFPGVNPSQQAAATRSRDEYHGTQGPLNITYNNTYESLVHPGVQTMNALGIHTNYDPNMGDATGIFNVANTVNRDTGMRSYTANTYFAAVKGQGNISVITDAQASRIIFSDGTSPDSAGITAVGVEFIVDGKTFTAHATKEVIVSAGGYQTPKILELSGIGDAKRLFEYGIPCLVDLPQVGENYQEHLGLNITFALKEELQKEEDLSSTLSAFSFFPLKNIVLEEVLADMVKELDNIVPSTPLQKAQFALQRQSINTQIGTAEILFSGSLGQTDKIMFWSMFAATQHPYSRGNIHIQSSDPLVQPKVDGHYLECPFDVAVLTKIAQFIRKLASTEPLGSYIAGPVIPPSTVETDEEYGDFTRKAVQTLYHPVGTAAMAPREIGGVVDTSLRVYGTRNVRVVDASIIPIHMAGHPQATVYAIAERAADIIKCGR